MFTLLPLLHCDLHQRTSTEHKMYNLSCLRSCCIQHRLYYCTFCGAPVIFAYKMGAPNEGAQHIIAFESEITRTLSNQENKMILNYRL